MICASMCFKNYQIDIDVDSYSKWNTKNLFFLFQFETHSPGSSFYIYLYKNTSIKVPVKFCVLFKAALIIKKKVKLIYIVNFFYLKHYTVFTNTPFMWWSGYMAPRKVHRWVTAAWFPSCFQFQIKIILSEFPLCPRLCPFSFLLPVVHVIIIFL